MQDFLKRLRFLSTLPARGATVLYTGPLTSLCISIHAPREGSDFPSVPTGAGSDNFYPRSPRGERHKLSGKLELLLNNISIHAPREGSDPSGRAFVIRRERISIHAPREGSDIARNTE